MLESLISTKVLLARCGFPLQRKKVYQHGVGVTQETPALFIWLRSNLRRGSHSTLARLHSEELVVHILLPNETTQKQFNSSFMSMDVLILVMNINMVRVHITGCVDELRVRDHNSNVLGRPQIQYKEKK